MKLLRGCLETALMPSGATYAGGRWQRYPLPRLRGFLTSGTIPCVPPGARHLECARSLWVFENQVSTVTSTPRSSPGRSPSRASMEMASRAPLMALFVGLFTFTVCYLRSFIFPIVPLLPAGDGLGFYVAGSRIVAGQLPYRDFFEIIPVGTDLTYALLIKCFGFYTWIPGAVMSCLAATVAALMTLIAARVMRSPMIMLPGFLLAGFVLLGSLDPTHHWFCTLAALAAMLVLLDGITFSRVAAAGVLCGLAACFTQTVGTTLTVGLSAYVFWKVQRARDPDRNHWGKALLLCGTAAAVFVLVNGYFIWAAGLRQWLFCLLIYPVRYFTVPAVNNWRVVLYDFRWHPNLGRWVSFPFVYAGVPLAYIFFALRMRRHSTKDKTDITDQPVLLALGGFSMLLAIAPAPSLLRLSTVSPPALILLVWLLNQPSGMARILRTSLGAAAVALAIATAVHYQTRWRAHLDLPAGRTAFSDRVQYEEYRWVLDHTHPGQFFYGMPPMYLPFHMLNPAAIEGIDPSDYTRPEQVAEVLQALQLHPVPIMIMRGLIDDPTSESDHSGSFRDYVRENYEVTKTFPNRDRVWERVQSRASLTLPPDALTPADFDAPRSPAAGTSRVASPHSGRE